METILERSTVSPEFPQSSAQPAELQQSNEETEFNLDAVMDKMVALAALATETLENHMHPPVGRRLTWDRTLSKTTNGGYKDFTKTFSRFSRADSVYSKTFSRAASTVFDRTFSRADSLVIMEELEGALVEFQSRQGTKEAPDQNSGADEHIDMGLIARRIQELHSEVGALSNALESIHLKIHADLEVKVQGLIGVEVQKHFDQSKQDLPDTMASTETHSRHGRTAQKDSSANASIKSGDSPSKSNRLANFSLRRMPSSPKKSSQHVAEFRRAVQSTESEELLRSMPSEDETLRCERDGKMNLSLRTSIQSDMDAQSTELQSNEDSRIDNLIFELQSEVRAEMRTELESLRRGITSERATLMREYVEEMESLRKTFFIERANLMRECVEVEARGQKSSNRVKFENLASCLEVGNGVQDTNDEFKREKSSIMAGNRDGLGGLVLEGVLGQEGFREDRTFGGKYQKRNADLRTNVETGLSRDVDDETGSSNRPESILDHDSIDAALDHSSTALDSRQENCSSDNSNHLGIHPLLKVENSDGPDMSNKSLDNELRGVVTEWNALLRRREEEHARHKDHLQAQLTSINASFSTFQAEFTRTFDERDALRAKLQQAEGELQRVKNAETHERNTHGKFDFQSNGVTPSTTRFPIQLKGADGTNVAAAILHGSCVPEASRCSPAQDSSREKSLMDPRRGPLDGVLGGTRRCSN